MVKFWRRDDRMAASSVVPEVTPDDKEIPPLRTWHVEFPGGNHGRYQGHELRVNPDGTAAILEYTGSRWIKLDMLSWVHRWNKKAVVHIGRYLSIEEVK